MTTQVSNANLNTPSPRGMITDHSQLHAPDVQTHQFPDPGQRMPGMQTMQPGMQAMRGTQQPQQRMQVERSHFVDKPAPLQRYCHYIYLQ